MYQFLTAGPNLAFTIALVVMLALALLEMLALLVGGTLSESLDTLLPDLGLDADADFELAAPEADVGLAHVLDWLMVGKAPLLILLMLFLVGFGISGLMLQAATLETFGRLIPGWIAWLPALLLALPVMHFGGRGFAKVIPKDETTAVSQETFVGRPAVITLGTAARGRPAQAKLKDQHGQTHYVMVEPSEEGDRFDAGARVLLISRHGGVFHVIREPLKEIASV